jgi:hypothetical protein
MAPTVRREVTIVNFEAFAGLARNGAGDWPENRLDQAQFGADTFVTKDNTASANP